MSKDGRDEWDALRRDLIHEARGLLAAQFTRAGRVPRAITLDIQLLDLPGESPFNRIRVDVSIEPDLRQDG